MKFVRSFMVTKSKKLLTEKTFGSASKYNTLYVHGTGVVAYEFCHKDK